MTFINERIKGGYDNALYKSSFTVLFFTLNLLHRYYSLILVTDFSGYFGLG